MSGERETISDVASTATRRSTRTAGLLWSLLMSALWHVGGGLLLFYAVDRGRSERLQPRLSDNVEITLFEADPSPNFESIGARQKSIPSKRIPRPHSRSSVSPSSAAPATAQAPLVTTAAIAPKESQSHPQVADAVARAPDLSFDRLPGARKEQIANMPNPQEDLERLLVPPPEGTGRRRPLDEVRAETERQEDAVDNVRLGRAHPLHFDYLRDARRMLTTEAARLGEQFPLGVAETTASWGRGYANRIAEISQRKTAADRPPAWADPVNSDRPDILGAYNEAQRQAEAGAVSRAAYVCLGVAPEHSVVVTLALSSGNSRLDRLAVDSFQSAVTRRPVATDIRPGLACYAVRVSAYRQPPLPSVSIGWNNGRPTLIYPLKGITKVTVELASVDYGVPAGPSSLLRRPH